MTTSTSFADRSVGAGLPLYLSSDVMARVGDCDAYGHLNNVNYLSFFLDAREDQIRDAYSLDVYGFAKKTGTAWVVSGHDIRYLRPIAAGETVRIRTCLIEADSRRVKVEGAFLDPETSMLKALVWSEFRVVGIRDGRPAAHPDELMALLKEVEIDPEAETVEGRVKVIRKGQKRTAKPA